MEIDVDIFANLQPLNQAAGTDIFANMSRTMNPPELTEPASARGSARTSLCELPLRSQRVGGFGMHELTVTAAQVKALLCGICKLVVREATHMDTAANLVPSCKHVFCASCLEGRLELFRTGKALQCPVCGRFVGLSTQILFWTVLS